MTNIFLFLCLESKTNRAFLEHKTKVYLYQFQFGSLENTLTLDLAKVNYFQYPEVLWFLSHLDIAILFFLTSRPFPWSTPVMSLGRAFANLQGQAGSLPITFGFSHYGSFLNALEFLVWFYLHSSGRGEWLCSYHLP